MFLLALCLFLIPHVSSEELLIAGDEKPIEDIKPILTELPTAQIDEKGFTFDDKVEFTRTDVKTDIGSKYQFYDSELLFFQGDLKQENVLSSNTESCSNDCVFTQDITTTIDTQLIEGVKFYRIQYEDDNVTEKSRVESSIRSFNLYIKGTDTLNIVEDYETQCKVIGYDLKNNSEIKECNNVRTGTTHDEYIENWIPYNYEVLKAGTYTLKGVGEKRADWVYDWVTTSQGKEMNDWSIWGGAGSSTLDRNLIAYYKLDETTGQAKDSVGNYNSTYLNALQGQPGKINNSYNFSSQNVSLPTLTYLNGNNMSVSAWIKFDTAVLGYYKIIGGNPNGFTFSLETNGGQNVLSLGKRGVDVTQSSLYITNLSEWNFVSASYNGTDVLFKLNNNTQIKTYGSNFSQTNYTIGQKSPDSLTEYFIGKIDELGIWNRSLSISELNDLYSLQLTQNKSYPFLGGSTIIINSPADNTLTSNTNINFNATLNVAGGAYLTNASLFLNGLFNQSQSLSSIANDKAVDRANGINNGTLVNGVVLNSSYARWGNGGAGFDGVNDYINGTALPLIINNFQTISLWVNIKNCSGAIITNRYNLTNQFAMGCRNTNGKIEGAFGNSTGGTYYWGRFASNSSVNLNSWNHILINYNGTLNLGNQSTYFYLNNVLQTVGTSNFGSASTSNNFNLGALGNPANFFNGSIDEVRIFNRSLTQEEITSLYTTNTIADTTGLVAYYDMENYSINNKTTAEVTFEKNLSDGNTNWSVQACDTDGACGFSENRTFTIDTISPAINILSPQPNQIIYNTNQNISLNLSITHDSSTIDKCWITTSYNTTNTYFNCSKNTSLFYPPTSPLNLTINVFSNDTANNVGNASVIVFKSLITPQINITSPTLENYLYNGKNLSLNYSITTNGTIDTCWYNYNSINTSLNCSLTNRTFIYVNGVDTIRVYANDTFGNLGSSNKSIDYDILIENVTYASSVLENQINTISINYLTNIPNVQVYLNYSDGQYKQLSTSSIGNNYYSYIDFYTNQTGNNTFYLSFYYAGNYYPIPNNTQEVKMINIGTCGGLNTYNLSTIRLYNEEDTTILSGYVNAVFYLLLTDNNYNISFTGSSYNICSSENLSSLYYNLFTRYTSSTFIAEELNVNNASAIYTEYNLFDLNESLSTQIAITYKDANNLPSVNKVVELYRYYPSTDKWLLVEAPITSNNGKAILHVNQNTQKYKIIIKDENGKIVEYFDNPNLFCTDLYSLCNIELSGGVRYEGINTNFAGIDYSVVKNNNSVVLIFSGNEDNQDINITIEKKNKYGSTTTYSSNDYSSSGIITIPIIFSEGDTINTEVTKDNVSLGVSQTIIPTDSMTNLFAKNNWIITIIIVLVFAGIGITLPESIILMSVIALVVSSSLFLLSGMDVVIGLGLLGNLIVAVVLIYYKMFGGKQ